MIANLFLAALLLASSSGALRPRSQAFLPRLSLQPDPSDAAQAGLDTSVCLDTRKPWGTAAFLPPASGTEGSLVPPVHMCWALGASGCIRGVTQGLVHCTGLAPCMVRAGVCTHRQGARGQALQAAGLHHPPAEQASTRTPLRPAIDNHGGHHHHHGGHHDHHGDHHHGDVVPVVPSSQPSSMRTPPRPAGMVMMFRSCRPVSLPSCMQARGLQAPPAAGDRRRPRRGGGDVRDVAPLEPDRRHRHPGGGARALRAPGRASIHRHPGGADE